MIEVHKYDRQSESFELSFRVNEDATVDGTTKNAGRIRQILNNYSGDPVEDMNYIKDIIRARYNSQLYQTVE